MTTPSAKRDLTQGGIFGTLLRLALPIAGSHLMQMTYNLTDMFWMGRIGSDALAATGMAGLFLWLSVGLMLIGKVGTDIGVSQARGRGDVGLAFRYARTGLYMGTVLGLLYGSFMFFLREPLVGLFNFQEQHVADDMATYMSIMAMGIPFVYISAAIGGSFGASGNTKTPFIINCIGLAVNMILSPVFIFVLGLGIRGAAITSVMAQTGVAITMLLAVTKSKGRPFERYPILGRFETALSAQIFKWTIPIFLESTLFCLLTMITSRFEVAFGAGAVAISRVGTQVESLTWLVGAGFGTAVTVFVGQNYGAGKEERITKGVRYAAWMMTGWGLLVTAILALGGGLILRIFLPDPELRSLGITFMRILAVCQIPACLEGVFGNAFKGKGRTIPPSVCSITSNFIRVPLAYLLSKTSLGLAGIWIAISFTACLRGVWVAIWYVTAARKENRA
ncbi:MAG: MATE family efflux transporter [Oscillospiraceae bacterium]|nr:MATE family efflux transporter [Oscillospiraceae bacterium]